MSAQPFQQPQAPDAAQTTAASAEDASALMPLKTPAVPKDEPTVGAKAVGAELRKFFGLPTLVEPEFADGLFGGTTDLYFDEGWR